MKFEKRVQQIASAEKDVDKVLKAARLQRSPMNNERLELILGFILILAFMGFVFGLFVLMTIVRCQM